MTGLSIRCFECNSHNDSRCAHDIPPIDLSVDCNIYKAQKGYDYTLCRKINQFVDHAVNGCEYLTFNNSDSKKLNCLFHFSVFIAVPAESRIVRVCGWDSSSYQNRCYQKGGFGGRQEVCSCNSDYCNSSNVHQIAAPILLSSIMVAFLMRLCK